MNSFFDLTGMLEHFLGGVREIPLNRKDPEVLPHFFSSEKKTDCYRKFDPENLCEILTSIESFLKIFENNYKAKFKTYILCILRDTEEILEYIFQRSDSSDFPLNYLYDVVARIVDIALRHPSEDYTNMLANLHRRSIRQMAAWSTFGSEDFVVRLPLLSILYDKIRVAKMKGVHNVEPLCNCMVSDECPSECELFLEVLTTNCELVGVETMLNVIQKFVQISGSNTILHQIWCEISKTVSNGYIPLEQSKSFIILCYLSDLYFSADGVESVCKKVFKDINFWILIQDGIMSEDATIRKQALYLLKRSLEYLQGCDVEFECFEKDVESTGKSDAKESVKPLMYWNQNSKQDLCEVFSEFINIVEYLEEKQSHLIEPIFDLIEAFIDRNMSTRGRLNVMWIIIILQRMLDHTNMKIIKFALLLLSKIDVCFSEVTVTKIIKLLITILNWTKLYANSWSEMSDLFTEYFLKCSRSSGGSRFFKILIREIGNVKWSSEALFFIVTAMSSITDRRYWGKHDVGTLKDLITRGTATHYTYIKSGILCQLLLMSLNAIDVRDISLTDLAAYLRCFSRKSSLQRGTEMWNFVTKRIRTLYKKEDAEEFIATHITTKSDLNSESVGKMVVLLYDSFCCSEGFAPVVMLENVLASFTTICERTYCDKQVHDRYLSILYHIVDESPGEIGLLKNIRAFIPGIVSYIQIRLSSACHVADLELCRNYVKILSAILNEYWHDRESIAKWAFNIIETLISDELNRSETSLLRKYPVQKYVHTSILNVLLQHVGWNELSNIERLQYWIKREVNNLPQEADDLSSSSSSTWRKMNLEILRENWQLLAKCVICESESVKLLRLGHEALDLGGSDVLIPVMAAIGSAAEMHIPLFESIINIMWTLIVERKKNEEFHALTEAFVEFLFRRDLIRSKDKDVRRILLHYAELMLTQSPVRSAALFALQIQRIGFNTNDNSDYFFMKVLPRALLYGQIQRRDEKLINDICSVIEGKGLTPLKNDCMGSKEIRLRAIRFVLTWAHQGFAQMLIDAVIAEEEAITRNKTRYFSHSYVHLVKQRLMQSLLILNRCVSQERDRKLWKWLWDKLRLENNQPSVRCMQEWCMLTILAKRPEFLDEIWSLYDSDVEKRTGCLCSLMSITCLAAKLVPPSSAESWLAKAVKTVFPYAMAQHFGVRLYAQVALKKLMELARERGFAAILDKYSAIDEGLHESIGRGASGKNYFKLLEDFWFAAFDPIRHYSLETILRDLPLLRNAPLEECFDTATIVNKYRNKEIKSDFPLVNVDRSLDEYVARKLKSNESSASVDVEVFDIIVPVDEDHGSETRNFQKKAIPIKTLAPSGEAFQQSCSSSRAEREDGLVVVASLVSRIPNLGGLSRTCEVFGASELVIGSLKYAEDKQFQSLSVTAEKWITVSELKPCHLKEYLMAMKEDGYTIFAAEQATNSRPLQSVKFPKKSILLLGNEKEGIPPSLLALTNTCVEIPQMGVVRSLNVHVTGALVMWEYAKQHQFCKS